jgi:hypothetical protein
MSIGLYADPSSGTGKSTGGVSQITRRGGATHLGEFIHDLTKRPAWVYNYLHPHAETDGLKFQIGERAGVTGSKQNPHSGEGENK